MGWSVIFCWVCFSIPIQNIGSISNWVIFKGWSHIFCWVNAIFINSCLKQMHSNSAMNMGMYLVLRFNSVVFLHVVYVAHYYLLGFQSDVEFQHPNFGNAGWRCFCPSFWWLTFESLRIVVLTSHVLDQFLRLAKKGRPAPCETNQSVWSLTRFPDTQKIKMFSIFRSVVKVL